MILIQQIGGLGNQLFQYALYRKLEFLGRNVKIDDYSWNYKIKVTKLCDLNIDYRRATANEIREYEDNSTAFYARVRRKLFGRRGKVYNEKSFNFDPNVLEIDDVCLVGYWQTERYFFDIRNELLQSIDLAKGLNLGTKEMLNLIKETNSVSVHIRRGDYKSPELIDKFGNICTDKYYAKAIEYMKEKTISPTFFVFSNDVEWVKTHFVGNEFIIVDINKGDKDYLDMYLMSECKHNVIANSSFSWWGAWLNKDENKIVVAPDKWINTELVKDIWCKSWTVLNG